MTRSQGDDLSGKMYKLESEVAKLQRVRHDLEVLLNDKVKDLFERIGSFESQIASLRTVISDHQEKYDRVVSELQRLQSEVDEAKNRTYAAARNGLTKNEGDKGVVIPSGKNEHLKAAEKALAQKNWAQAITLFEQYQKMYPDENDALFKTHVQLGDALREQGMTQSGDEKTRSLKKAVVSLQKSLNHLSDDDKRAEVLLNVGICLKELNNIDGARAAFQEVLDKLPKSKKNKEAQKLLSELDK